MYNRVLQQTIPSKRRIREINDETNGFASAPDQMTDVQLEKTALQVGQSVKDLLMINYDIQVVYICTHIISPAVFINQA